MMDMRWCNRVDRNDMSKHTTSVRRRVEKKSEKTKGREIKKKG
jgi:hypothetical protein